MVHSQDVVPVSTKHLFFLVIGRDPAVKQSAPSCATIAYHVELNAEYNRPVAGLQLRLEVLVYFSEFRIKIYTKLLPNYQSESRLQSPSAESRVCKKPKTRI